MNDLIISEMSNQQLVLGYLNVIDNQNLRDAFYYEMCQRLTRWEVLPHQRTHMPRQVIVDLFRRHMHYRDSDANGVYIPPDRVETYNQSEYEDTDWFEGEDEEDDLFKI